MAIFASTTTSGYSDPLKALSIKALEQRQRDMQTQQAQQAAQMFSPENTQTPIQGFGQLANVIGDRFQQGRADAALGAQRDALAKIRAGIDPEKGATPQQIADVGRYDADAAKEMAQQVAEIRRQNAGFAHADKTQAEQFRLQQEGKKADEQRKLEAPTDLEIVKLDRAKQRGEIDQPTYDMMRKKLVQGPVSEQKFVKDLQEQSVAGQSLLASLDEALALTNHPKGIHSGGGAGFAQGVGEKVPKALQGITSAVGIDPETVSNTQRYNQIMGEQALELLNKMKGASSDRDVQVNFKIVNDPDATLKNKQLALGRMRDRIATLLELHNNTIKEAGGAVPTLSTASSGGAPAAAGGAAAASQDAQALEWAKANQNDPRAAEIMKRLGK